MRLYFVYTMVQKSQKWPKTQIKGSCLNRANFRKSERWQKSTVRWWLPGTQQDRESENEYWTTVPHHEFVRCSQSAGCVHCNFGISERTWKEKNNVTWQASRHSVIHMPLTCILTAPYSVRQFCPPPYLAVAVMVCVCACVRACVCVYVSVCACVSQSKNCQTNGKHDKRYRRYFK